MFSTMNLVVGLASLASIFAAKGNWTDIAMDYSGKYQYATTNNKDQSTTIWKSVNYGGTWTKTKSPSYDWTTIFTDSAGNLVVAGSACFSTVSSCPPLYVSKDGGDSWVASSGIPATDSFNDDIVGDAKGATLYTTRLSSLYRSTNYGLNWTKVEVPNREGNSLVGGGIAVDSSAVYVFSSYSSKMAVSSDMGSTWVLSDVKGSNTGDWHAYASSTSGQYVYAASDYALYYSENFGGVNSWQLLSQTSPPQVATMHLDVACDASGQYVYIASGDKLQRYLRNSNTFYETTVKGEVSSVATSSSGKYVSATVKGGYIWISNDYGVTFNAIA